MKLLKSTVIYGHNVTFFKKTNGEHDFLIEDVNKFDPSWKKIFWYMINEGILLKEIGKKSTVAALLGLKDNILSHLDKASSDLKLLKEITEED